MNDLWSRIAYRCWYTNRVYYSLLNHCWRCLIDPFHR